MNNIYLQIFMLANVFLMGVLVTLAIRHARAHFAPKEPEKPKLIATVPQVSLPPMVKTRLVKEAEDDFIKQLSHSVDELQNDLRETSSRLNRQLQQLGSEVAISEKGRYQTMLEDLRKRTEIAISAAQAELSQHQVELKGKMAEAMAAEQAMLVKQIDMKLADAVGSFLTEALGHNVDLGAQSTYLVSLLEQHKDDFKREVSDGTPAAK